MRKVKVAVLSVLNLAALLAAYVYMRLKRSAPVTDGELELPGLSGPVEVTFDQAGVPHIKADSDEDGLRTLGYLVAQDRLVQLEMMKRIASGTLSELISLLALDIDHFMRTIGFSRMAREFALNLNDETRRLAQAYIDGVNDYISRDGSRLPVEFMLLGGRPDPWKQEDLFTIALFAIWLLDTDWFADLMREKLIRKLGLRIAMKLLPETSDICEPACKTGGNGCQVETLEPGEEIDWGFDAEGGGGEWLKGRFTPAVAGGSNNWVVDGSKSVTGKPILCSDPHIQHMVPSTMYLFHLNTPGFNVIGAGYAGLPVVVIGHNQHCAWGMTTLHGDMRNLYVETFESDQSDRYLYKGEWLEPEVRIEEVRLRFLGTRRLKVVETIHGPVIKRKGAKGLALKWAGADTSFNLLQPFLDMNAAGNWQEFRQALSEYLGPGCNFVYADTEGNIGYQAGAKVPVRARGDGTIPYHGQDGDCEWTGYIPFEEMPTAENPPEGFIATANNKIVTEEYPHLITKCWEPPCRQGRIAELLRSKDKFSLDDMRRIQGDIFTDAGRVYSENIAEAAAGRTLEPDVAEAVGRLAGWDHEARADSVAMTIYFYGWLHLTALLLKHRLGDSLFEDYARSWLSLNVTICDLLEERAEDWLPPQFASYQDLLLSSLKGAIDELTGAFKTQDQSRWVWGKVHSLTAFHPLGLFWPLTKIFNVGPVPRDGEAETVNRAMPESDPGTQLLARGTFGGSPKLAILPDEKSHAAYAGSVCRFVADLSDWDNSRMVLDVGQSGHRLSPHYKDHFEKWLNVDYYPLPFTEEKIEQFKEGTVRFVPE